MGSTNGTATRAAGTAPAPPAPRRGLDGARAAGLCAQVAGVVWILQWSHALVAHGPTDYDLTRIWLGMTWFDSGKFLVLPFLLLVPGVRLVAQRSGTGRGRILGRVVTSVLVAAAVATALQFWPYPWGRYPNGLPFLSAVGGPLQAITSSMVLPTVLALLGIHAARARAMPGWLVPVLVLGALATVFLAGPLPPVPGLAWLAFGGWLLTQTPGTAGPPRWNDHG